MTHNTTEEQRELSLNLEETGLLCHLVLQAMTNGTSLRHKQITSVLNADPAAFGKRVRALYEKLASANDELMGKK